LKGIALSSTNKDVVLAFIEDVLNQGRWERLNDLVLGNFVELDPLPMSSSAFRRRAAASR
jgi:hypothetical protein